MESTSCPNCGQPIGTDAIRCRNCSWRVVGVLDDGAGGGGRKTHDDPRLITFASGKLTLERDGPIAAADVLKYDREGRVTWTSDKSRDRVVNMDVVAHPLGKSGFTLALVGFVFAPLWIVSLVVCWLNIRRGRREQRSYRLAVAGFWISVVPVGAVLVFTVIMVVSLAGQGHVF